MKSRGMGIINPKKCCSKVLSEPTGMKAGGKVKAFKSHMMYDKKTGKGVKAPTMAKHLELKKKGYGHTKPTKMKKGGSVKDACYHKVKSSYKVFPSAYASGAIAKCRKKKGKK